VGFVRRYQNVRKLAGKTIRQTIICMFDLPFKMPRGRKVIGVYLNPVFAGGFTTCIRNNMRGTIAGVFIADEFISHLLDDAGAEYSGAENGD
jgi:hypothetical protein